MLIFIDEGLFLGDRKGMNQFKAMVTECSFNLNEKGRDAVTLPSFSNFCAGELNTMGDARGQPHA